MDASLVKAARALLDWHQEDLAKASGISLTAIKNFEKKTGSTRNSTIAALRAAFEANGVEFPTSGGLRKSDDATSITRHSGNDFIHFHFESMFARVRRSGSEILTCSIDDTLWQGPSVAVDNQHFHDWCERLNIVERILIVDGESHPALGKQHYRALPKGIIGKLPYTIYEDYISFIFWKKKAMLYIA